MEWFKCFVLIHLGLPIVATYTIFNLTNGTSYIEAGKDIIMKWPIPISSETITIYNRQSSNVSELIVGKKLNGSNVEFDLLMNDDRFNVSSDNTTLEVVLSSVKLTDSASFYATYEDKSRKSLKDSKVYVLNVYEPPIQCGNLTTLQIEESIYKLTVTICSSMQPNITWFLDKKEVVEKNTSVTTNGTGTYIFSIELARLRSRVHFVVSLYQSQIHGFVDISDSSVNDPKDGGKGTVDDLKNPAAWKVIVGVGSVILFVLALCCISHCILVRKRRCAMRAVKKMQMRQDIEEGKENDIEEANEGNLLLSSVQVYTNEAEFNDDKVLLNDGDDVNGISKLPEDENTKHLKVTYNKLEVEDEDTILLKNEDDVCGSSKLLPKHEGTKHLNIPYNKIKDSDEVEILLTDRDGVDGSSNIPEGEDTQYLNVSLDKTRIHNEFKNDNEGTPQETQSKKCENDEEQEGVFIINESQELNDNSIDNSIDTDAVKNDQEKPPKEEEDEKQQESRHQKGQEEQFHPTSNNGPINNNKDEPKKDAIEINKSPRQVSGQKKDFPKKSDENPIKRPPTATKEIDNIGNEEPVNSIELTKVDHIAEVHQQILPKVDRKSVIDESKRKKDKPIDCILLNTKLTTKTEKDMESTEKPKSPPKAAKDTESTEKLNGNVDNKQQPLTLNPEKNIERTIPNGGTSPNKTLKSSPKAAKKMETTEKFNGNVDNKHQLLTPNSEKEFERTIPNGGIVNKTLMNHANNKEQNKNTPNETKTKDKELNNGIIKSEQSNHVQS